jgi:Tol biopolymer transport system component
VRDHALGAEALLDLLELDGDVRDQGRDIWIWDNRALSRLTTTEAAEEYGLWTPDGLRVIFSRRIAGIAGRNGILWTRADGIGEPELLVERENAFPNAVTGDGKTLIFRGVTVNGSGNDIFAVPLEGDRKVRTLIATKHDELNAALSPHSDWMAYQSDLSGRPEVYVRPFPNVDAGQVLISTGGGTEPLWAPDGTEIFYRGADHMLMSVAVTMIGSELKAQPPKPLFDMSSYSSFIGRNYDITPDGKRFLMVKTPPARTPSQITVVLDWLEELKRLR